MIAAAYVRVSSEEQGDSGLGLEAQAHAIDVACVARGWHLRGVYEEVASGATFADRPVLVDLLGKMREGYAQALIVSRVDRLSRSLMDFAELMERSRTEGWAIVALDLGVDTTTPSGELIANLMAAFSQYERRLIGDRTRAALAALRARGVHLGRDYSVNDETVAVIREARSSGWTFQRIADWLNEQRVPTTRGGREWYHSTVRKVLTR